MKVEERSEVVQRRSWKSDLEDTSESAERALPVVCHQIAPN